MIAVMEKLQTQIRINYTDRDINSMLRSQATNGTSYTRHYTQNEEFFLKLSGVFSVPSFPIHHDVRQVEPTQSYLETIKMVLNAVVPLVPQLFEGLTYYFDPTDTLRPAFFQLYRLGDLHYLYLMKIDLTFKHGEHEMTRAGTNDSTPEYRTSKLFLEGIVVPIEQVETEGGKMAGFGVKQTVSQTWIGETGRGYFVQGIWMDHELTKFFSKLFLPKGKRTYPYYPFQCRYRTICSTVIETTSEARKRNPPLLHRALQFVVPVMDTIQESLRSVDFSEQIEAFTKLKRLVPEFWSNVWSKIAVTPYLNERDMKEFRIDP